MKGPILTLAMATTVAVLALPNQAAAQVPPPAKRAKRVRIVEAPRPELVVGGYLTIIRWTTNNPGGTDDHFGVVYYGTDSKNLDQTAKSPTRLNQAHPTTTFRVRLDQLEPQTTYYFRVDCEDATGRSDGVKSPIGKFITPAAGQRIPASPRGARG
ncbi:MAG TPA: fibronectin type III domain-containing protein [Myxococcales bacterium]|nr:fibronectin type III domain-containing protein [Myxococcales bacterium]